MGFGYDANAHLVLVWFTSDRSLQMMPFTKAIQWYNPIRFEAPLQWLYNLLLFDVVFLMIIYALAERKKFVLVLIITQRWVDGFFSWFYVVFRIITRYGQLRFFMFCIFIANWNIFGVSFGIIIFLYGTELQNFMGSYASTLFVMVWFTLMLGVIDLARRWNYSIMTWRCFWGKRHWISIAFP